MNQSFIKSHNSDTASPRRDWREGDLVGVLAITRPLDRDIARTQSGLQLAFLVTGIIALVFVGLCLGFLVRARMRRCEGVRAATVRERTAATAPLRSRL